ncbi:hypothetical protein ASJ81_04700 [Methanosarcina spelaei]|uniref:DUF1622 domain-containing protein n=1 Tax=Methanosarcina spelaei TaxID=1036679 RepID=A0A2A2HUJ5_9EURY|nr:hypothetical protein ASJ81_04700 [Methanosarcina spelaei]
MLSGLFNNFLLYFEWIFEAIGTTIIIYGGLRATIQILFSETLKKSQNLETIRKELTNRILFGLEFYIVVAILGTLRNPAIQDLTVLGTVVLIRTVLGYFLSKEVKEYQFD